MDALGTNIISISCIESRIRFSSYSYVFLRLIELESLWIACVEDIEFKLALGNHIGNDGERLSITVKRLGELFYREKPYCTSEKYAELFNVASQLTSPQEITSFLASIYSDLCFSMTCYLTKATSSEISIADEPSSRLIRRILAELDEYIPFLSKWSGDVPKLNVGLEETFEEEKFDNSIYHNNTFFTLFPETPSRPYYMKLNFDYNPPSLDDDRLVSSSHVICEFFHFVVFDIEIAAMEICARNMVEFSEMPVEFKIDMARQIWDEARHATLLRDYIHDLGYSDGQFELNSQVWRRYLIGRSLAERLAIQQVVQEGNSVESNIKFSDRLFRLGFKKLARIIDFINADETKHALFGNKWLMFLCNGDYAQYRQEVFKAAETIGWSLPFGDRCKSEARLLSGFPKEFVLELIAVPQNPSIS